MPDHIVQHYRNLFWDRLAPAIKDLPGTFRIPAFEGDFGFKDSYIIITHSANSHFKLWATNSVREYKTGFVGHITLNRDLTTQRTDLKTRIIAREWIEVMIGLRDLHSTSMHSRVNGREELIVVLDENKQPAIWQDPTEQEIRLEAAVRELLVSSEELRIFAENIGMPIPHIIAGIKEKSPEAAKQVPELVRRFCEQRDVPIDIVWERLKHLLGIR